MKKVGTYILWPFWIHILRPSGICYGNWEILWVYVTPFWYIVSRKIWQPWHNCNNVDTFLAFVLVQVALIRTSYCGTVSSSSIPVIRSSFFVTSFFAFDFLQKKIQINFSAWEERMTWKATTYFIAFFSNSNGMTCKVASHAANCKASFDSCSNRWLKF
jgi:hypothetical protein